MFSGLCLKADARRLRVHALESGNVFFHRTPSPLLTKHFRSWPPIARGADDNYWLSGCDCTGVCGCALACGDGRVGTGLRVGVAIGRGGGADILGCGVRSEALAIRRAIWSWLALSYSTALALSLAI